MRNLTRFVLFAALALGLACLNYTNGFGIEHHAEWASGKGLPPPSPAIFYGGAAATVLGALLLGHSFGRKRAA